MFDGKWITKIKRKAAHKCKLPDIDIYDNGSAWLCRRCRQIYMVTSSQTINSKGQQLEKYRWIVYEETL